MGMQDSCAEAYTADSSDFFIGTSHSARMTLADNQDPANAGAVAYPRQLAEGKFNEMNPGTYLICYAPRHTSGDASNDFKALAVQFEILPPTVEGPGFGTPSIVALGADIVVTWYSNLRYSDRYSQPGAWIGLYRNQECSPQHGAQLQHAHECYLAFAFLPDGETSGEVRFSVNDYKLPGLYEARYFRGDTMNGQGQACRGLDGRTQTYVECVFEAAAVSDVINIPGDIMGVERRETSHMEAFRDATQLDKFRREHVGR